MEEHQEEKLGDRIDDGYQRVEILHPIYLPAWAMAGC